MQRVLKLSKFRNIGIKKDEFIVLNQTIEKGKMGDLVICIGQNNSGKSNVLDAIFAIGNSNSLTKRDITTLSYTSEDSKPSIALVYRDDDGQLSYKLDLNGSAFLSNHKMGKTPFDSEKAMNELSVWISAFEKSETHYIKDIVSSLREIKMTNEEQFIADIKSVIESNDKVYLSPYERTDYVKKLASLIENKNGRLYKEILKSPQEKPDILAKYILDNYGISFLPKIVRYQEKAINVSNMTSTYANLANNAFFKSLFNAIGADCSEITKAYEQFKQFNNIAIFSKIKKQLNSKIESLNEQFNTLYFAKNDKYKFYVELDANGISFGMARGKNEDPIMLDYQSTGFRWFFNLFFNFISSNELNPGDIIIMDEPATNLHPQGQKELRLFIKTFAMKNDLTFILATHSPFLIDTDNYDELRVVSMNDNIATIDNLFSAVNANDPDSLLPIKESLTIKQNVLYELNTEVIWVEGITDYNYLTMFKNLLNIKNLAFVPFQGVGANDQDMQRIVSRLISIEFHKKNMLCDGDKAGQIMKKFCADTAFSGMMCISDLSTDSNKFKEIEDLFSSGDKKKFDVINVEKPESYKKSRLSSIMKKNCKIEDFSKETINNFKKLFEMIQD